MVQAEAPRERRALPPGLPRSEEIPVPYAPHAKRHSTRAASSRRNSDSEDDTEEPDHTLLTKANIPSIVHAVLCNISTEENSSRDDSQDVSHLGEWTS